MNKDPIDSRTTTASDVTPKAKLQITISPFEAVLFGRHPRRRKTDTPGGDFSDLRRVMREILPKVTVILAILLSGCGGSIGGKQIVIFLPLTSPTTTVAKVEIEEPIVFERWPRQKATQDPGPAWELWPGQRATALAQADEDPWPMYREPTRNAYAKVPR